MAAYSYRDTIFLVLKPLPYFLLFHSRLSQLFSQASSISVIPRSTLFGVNVYRRKSCDNIRIMKFDIVYSKDPNNLHRNESSAKAIISSTTATTSQSFHSHVRRRSQKYHHDPSPPLTHITLLTHVALHRPPLYFHRLCPTTPQPRRLILSLPKFFSPPSSCLLIVWPPHNHLSVTLYISDPISLLFRPPSNSPPLQSPLLPP